MKIEDNGHSLEIFLEEIPAAVLVAPEEENGKIKVYFARHYQVNGGGILSMLYGQLKGIKLGYFNMYGVNDFDGLKKLIKESPDKFFDIVLTVIFSRVERLEELEEQLEEQK